MATGDEYCIGITMNYRYMLLLCATVSVGGMVVVVGVPRVSPMAVYMVVPILLLQPGWRVTTFGTYELGKGTVSFIRPQPKETTP